MVVWYEDGVDNIVAENSSICEYISCHQQGYADTKTLLQQNLPVLNCGCRLTEVDLNNGCEMVVAVADSILARFYCMCRWAVKCLLWQTCD